MPSTSEDFDSDTPISDSGLIAETTAAPDTAADNEIDVNAYVDGSDV